MLGAGRWAAGGVGVLALALLACAEVTGAAFTASTAAGGSAFTGAVLAPPTGLSASRDCGTAPVLRDSTIVIGKAASVSVARPAGTVAGDVLLAIVAHHDGGKTPAMSGWTQVHEVEYGGSDGLVVVFHKVAGSAEASSYAVTGLDENDGTVVTALAYGGVDTAAPLVASAVVRATSVVAPSLTATRARNVLVTAFAADDYGDTTASGDENQTLTASAAADTTRQMATATAPQPITLRVLDRAVGSGPTATSTGTIISSKPLYGVSVLLASATAGNGAVSLSWTPTTDTYATGYGLSRDGGAETSLPGRTTSTATGLALAPATSATYALRSVAGTWRSSAATVSVAAC
ncbi:hypothetical protein [Kineococcus sp. SYSU DK004]|uniref:hypothetical protein n=1 Tax=Kineococcus sp. SYSU DK004 TaxID=3383125 RepID=UPI003D7D4411